MLALGLWAWTADARAGVTVTCEGGADANGYVTVKNPHSRLKDSPDSPWIKQLAGKIADFKSAEDACAAILDLARSLELQVDLKDKTTVVIHGRDLKVKGPPGLRLKIEQFDAP